VVSLRGEFEVKGRLIGKGEGIADWWSLITRPLGMAPREPLDDAETRRDETKEGVKTRTQTGGTLALPGRHAWPSLLLTVLRAGLYIFQSVKFTI
jgi:hypothetical protein